MKISTLKIFAFSSLLISGIGCAQKSDTKTVDQSSTESVAVEQDSAAIAEAKKKAAAEEKAKLPKPYNAAENAEARIAELVKQAKAENKINNDFYEKFRANLTQMIGQYRTLKTAPATGKNAVFNGMVDAYNEAIFYKNQM